MKVVFWVTVSTSALKYGIKHVIRKCRPTLATVKVKCKLFHKYILFFMTSRLQFRNLNAIIKLKCTGWLESSVWSFRPSGRPLWCYQFQRFPVLRILLFVFSRLLRFLWLGKWRHTFGSMDCWLFFSRGFDVIIWSYLEDGQAMVLLLDFSQAFDMVVHKLLLNKMRNSKNYSSRSSGDQTLLFPSPSLAARIWDPPACW
jgi:hypothetical protein